MSESVWDVKKSGREPGQIRHVKCVIPGILVERSDGNKSGGRECKEGQKKLLSVWRHRSVPGRPQPTFFSVSCGSVCDANLDIATAVRTGLYLRSY